MPQFQISSANALFAVIALVIAFPLWSVLRLALFHPLRSALRHLPGPKSTSWILGNLQDLAKDEHGALVNTWVEACGNTLSYKGLLNSNLLLTTDTRAMQHILTRTDVYQKPPETRKVLGQLFGEGLLVVEDPEHRQQRRIMNPAFGPTQIRELTETFFSKAIELRDIWSSEIASDPTASITGTRIDAIPWLNKVTLDIIGLAGFNYDFRALASGEEPNELKEAFSTLFSSSQQIGVFDILQTLVPVLRLVPTVQSRKLGAAQRSMAEIGRQLLRKAKAIAEGEMEANKERLRGRDLLSLLVKANMATGVAEGQKLSDKDVIAQVPTFLVAGHETTSTAVSWALYALTQAPDVQTKLREELLSIDTDTPSMDELNALPYLDAVVRETLRVYPPVIGTSRIAIKDDVLPLEKPYTDQRGVVRDTIAMTKGDPITIPIEAMNRSKELWGPDAHEFKPERWNDIPGSVSRVPGIWGHMLTFIGGPRACIGFRFSLVESKAILFSLIRAFEFELAVPASQIGTRTAIVQRPVLQDDPTHQPQLPLLIKPYERV